MREISPIKIIYIDCKNSGISGDIFLSALSLLSGEDSIFKKTIEFIQQEFKDVKLFKAEFEEVYRNGLYPRILKLEFDEQRHITHIDSMKQKIIKIIQNLKLSKKAIDFAGGFFKIIAEAESFVHKTTPDKVHLHEIGSIDTVIDICGITAYLEKIGVFSESSNKVLKLVCSPIAVGGGNVKIEQGVVPVPAPATSAILEKYNIPIIGGPVEKELCTPTGAALIGCLVEKCNLEFSQFIPCLSIEKRVMGTGNIVMENFPNILCIYSGKVETSEYVIDDLGINYGLMDEEIAVIETTVDDTSGEIIGHMMDLLLKNGALDVNFVNVQSKKNRPATLIRVLTDPINIERMIFLIINNLGTLGVRYHIEHRKCLERKIIEKTTSILGKTVTYHVKIATVVNDPDKVIHYKIEYDDLATISKKLGRNISEIKTILDAEFLQDKNIKN